MKKNNKRAPSYLDVAEFMMSGPFSPKIQTGIMPLEVEHLQVTHFQQLETEEYLACRGVFSLIFSYQPIYIQIGGNPSPYLKELLGKVGNAEIEFMDFTLEGPNESDEQFQEEEGEKQMSAIQQQQQQEKSSLNEKQDKQSKFQYNPEEYIPNMHLLELDSYTFTHEQFEEGLKSVQEATEEDRRQYISLYLTDDDLQNFKDATIQELIQVVQWNLSNLGIITRLERKSKVARYLQKKKRRIWKKKINYDCRKKVADNRLRIKGKFVTRQQACEMLGVELTSFQNLKKMLLTKKAF